MTHEEFNQILPDYVLGLLPAGDQGHLKHHLAQCPSCRAAVARERNLTRLVRSTIHKAAKPDTHRLVALMPDIPQKKKRWGPFTARWQTQLAPVMLIVIIIFAAILTKTPGSAKNNPLLFATSNIVTATSTHTPTATLAQSAEQQDGHNDETVGDGGQAALIQSPSPKPAINTPVPQPTPVAAVRTLSTN